MRVLLTSFGSYGDLNPYVGLGQVLQARGHRPVLAMTAAYRPHIEGAGLECYPTRPEGDPADRTLIGRIMDPLWGAEYLIKRVMMPNLRDMYDDLFEATRNVDVVISHPLSFAAPIVCAQRDLPWAASVLAPLSFFSWEDPPLAIPSPVAAAVHRRWPKVYRPLNAIGQRMAQAWSEPVQDLRASLGLPRGRNPMGAGQFSPHLNLGLFSSVMASPQADWPAHTMVTGAVTHDALHGGLSDEIEEFLAAGPPPVVFTLGSSAVGLPRASHFYDVSAAVAAALGIRAILLVGSSLENRPAAVSGDVLVADWAPHSELFPRTAAIVHQGGAGTLHTALAAGRPVLIVPFAYDQPDNAARVERLGIARSSIPNDAPPCASAGNWARFWLMKRREHGPSSWGRLCVQKTGALPRRWRSNNSRTRYPPSSRRTSRSSWSGSTSPA
jgi:UDP:flavonoid glycosyltransferase YjiC (YdhE family)